MTDRDRAWIYCLLLANYFKTWNAIEVASMSDVWLSHLFFGLGISFWLWAMYGRRRQ